ncbi:ankyrin and het domain protein [Colletotrichum sojae]|uniref:Ankyrin and het domain protein n=1 Tax=Colletotrichum sojae TaxID=2175907 RepID=A0A8H6J8H2_9PEZI|nr:ankyrin and het domain protein [Colletotrichum sojae]
MQDQPGESVPAYAYEAIGKDQSRMFFLCPAENFDDDIRGWLLPHDLKQSSDSFAYEALSYVWGNADGPKHTLTLLDAASPDAFLDIRAKPTGTLKIGQNLADALRNLRREDEHRTLWIDAICINQEDNDDRSRQVQRMGNIYHNAQAVVVFLCPASEQTSRALEIVRHLATVYDWRSTDEVGRIQSSNPEYALLKPLPHHAQDWLCLYDLFGLPWFRRVWIRQEITLANKAVMMVGREALDWATFRGVSMCIKSKMWQFPAPLSEGLRDRLADYMISIFALQSLSSFSTFFQFIGRTGISECKDKRDYIYGLLALCDLDITPDYNKGEREVHVEAFVNHTSHVRDLRLLLFCNMADGPSWAPDFSRPVSGLLTEAPSFACGDTVHLAPSAAALQAGGEEEWRRINNTFDGCDFELLSDMELKVSAVHCGTVEWRTEMMPRESYGDKAKTTLGSWFRDVFSGHGHDVSDDRTTDALVRAIMFGNVSGEWMDMTPGLQECKDILLQGVEGYSRSPAVSRLSPRHIFNILKTFLPGTALFQMSGNHFALGFGDFRSGDGIFVIKGCPKPMILRLEGGKYKVIGACEVPHLQRGEGFLGPLPEGWKMKLMGHNVMHRLFVGPDDVRTEEDPRRNPLIQGEPFRPHIESLVLV